MLYGFCDQKQQNYYIYTIINIFTASWAYCIDVCTLCVQVCVLTFICVCLCEQWGLLQSLGSMSCSWLTGCSWNYLWKRWQSCKKRGWALYLVTSHCNSSTLACRERNQVRGYTHIHTHTQMECLVASTVFILFHFKTQQIFISMPTLVVLKEDSAIWRRCRK